MKKVFIVPADGFPTAQILYNRMIEIMAEPQGMVDYVSHIKFNDALHLDDIGSILDQMRIEWPKINFFFDLKLPDTNGTDVNILKHYIAYMRPGDIVTVTSTCSLRAFKDIREVLPTGVKIALVSALSDTGKEECRSRRGMSPAMAILNDAMNLLELMEKPFDAIVCAVDEVSFLVKNLPADIEFIAVGVRDEWMEMGQQSADRAAGIQAALYSGATFLVAGGQLSKGNPNKEVGAINSRQRSIDLVDSAAVAPLVKGNLLQTLVNLQGYYQCQRNPDGSFKGPLVTYSGTYIFQEAEKNYVGDVYFNLAKIESHPAILGYFAEIMAEKIREFEKKAGSKIECLVGVPTGGVKIAQEVGRILGVPGICLEKEIKTLKTDNQKEKSDLVFRRNAGIVDGKRVILFEDLCNNFSTTNQANYAVTKAGGGVVGIACIINRSMTNDRHWHDIPIIAGEYIPAGQYMQEDPKVSGLIAKGLLSTDPKKDWAKLKQAMEQ